MLTVYLRSVQGTLIYSGEIPMFYHNKSIQPNCLMKHRFELIRQLQ